MLAPKALKRLLMTHTQRTYRRMTTEEYLVNIRESLINTTV